MIQGLIPNLFPLKGVYTDGNRMKKEVFLFEDCF